MSFEHAPDRGASIASDFLMKLLIDHSTFVAALRGQVKEPDHA
jgi:hypothetical protein